MHEVEIDGGRLRILLQQLLRETNCLKFLTLDDVGNHEDLAAGLSEGLRGNKSLKALLFEMSASSDDQGAVHFVTNLESLLENRALRQLHDITL
jgi:hypothetical protein